MIEIKLNKKGFLYLPETWDEVPVKHLPFIFNIVQKVLSSQLDIVDARLQILFKITGYKPKFKLKDRENINFNLFKLSELLNFAFTINENKIISPNLNFKRNPVPYFKIGNKTYQGKEFIRDFTVKTDLTAHDYADCFDIINMYRSNPDARADCLNHLCAVIYPGELNQAVNFKKANPFLQYGVFLWFSGILNFYFNHPIYSILFSEKSDSSHDPSKIYLGMNETILSLTQEGYSKNMNLTDFFDAQIKLLKDKVNSALASGAKIQDVAAKTKIELSVLSRLI